MRLKPEYKVVQKKQKELITEKAQLKAELGKANSVARLRAVMEKLLDRL